MELEDLKKDPAMLEQVFREWMLFKSVVQDSPLGFAVFDADQRLIEWNTKYEENHSFAFSKNAGSIAKGTLTYRDLIRLELQDVVAPEELDGEVERRARIHQSATGQPIDRVYDVAGHVRIYKYALQNGGVAGICMEINDLFAANEALAKSRAELTAQNEQLSQILDQYTRERQRMQLAAQTAGFGVWSWDVLNDDIVWDAQVYEIFGLSAEEPLPGRAALLNRVYAEDRVKVEKALLGTLKGEEALDLEIRIERDDKQPCFARICANALRDEDGTTIGLTGVAIDLTETRQIQEKLARRLRLESIGQLTGGIAHDFNNLLAIIVGRLEELDEGEHNPDRQALIASALRAAESGVDLTGNLLSFARKAPLFPKVLNLNETLEASQGWIARAIPNSIALETQLEADLWPIKSDRASIENAILNLLLNARDAMPTGGKIKITTENVFVAATGKHKPADRSVKLTVSDTGTGIPEKDIPNLFEPFFTTKEQGKNSGLGLSMVHGFVSQTGGQIDVRSEEGKGTSFSLIFPATDDDVVPVSDSASVQTTASRAPATILIVDDNEIIVEIMESMLESAGYAVLKAENAASAVATFAKAPQIDLVISDVAMPGELQGPALAHHLRELRPNLPVLFVSGYTFGAEVKDAGLTERDVLLTKPVRKAKLLGTVDHLINKHRIS